MASKPPEGWEPVRCSAHNRRGNPCGQWAIRGGNVCKTHGGSAPQVKLAAKIRLAALVDPAIGVLAESLKKRKGQDREDIRLRAALAVLDRTGHHPGQTITLDGNVGVTADDSALEAFTSRIARLASRSGTPGGDSDSGRSDGGEA